MLVAGFLRRVQIAYECISVLFSFEVCRRGPLNRDVTFRPPLAVAWEMVAISESVNLVHQSFSPRCTTTGRQ